MRLRQDEERVPGHIITVGRVAMDAGKVQAVLDWLVPKSVRTLRVFLGLAGYYRKFVQDYGRIAASLTTLLCKEGFGYSNAASAVFTELKMALTTAPVLALPALNKPFIM
jgi:hypothetical protein